MGNEYELMFDYEGKNWKKRNGLIVSEDEIDVGVYCPCGNKFYIYITYTPIRCVCGRIYRAIIKLEEDEVE